ncbi:uncharacterized protein MONBRDRAFT_30952 [Monosiga brevicollis MX1]|uniref:NAD(+) kinase n=1 Tax=Monosiga brevicollis TaxID=81824 RepID=A9UQD2_MONBE|nr:uncharacterized protein MONBRDRAFT_30952 [Monosiga brevicollis MX1]EDQ93025.1 predicted protein [Monosiga brevicollis MX1]|eukprot:XP_001742787.1 hypothetical protein [Monosiga brevicollis MX1]
MAFGFGRGPFVCGGIAMIRTAARRLAAGYSGPHWSGFRTPQPYKRPHFFASSSDKAQEALQELLGTYYNHDLHEADCLVALGGDGHMLTAMHLLLNERLNIPVYGMNRGTVGFLMNNYKAADLFERLQQAQVSHIHPLRMTAYDVHGEQFQAVAINEVSLFRQTRQAAHITVIVDGQERMNSLICDGVLLATPAGSTAYNLSAHGPVVPLGSGLLALTPISPFRPRRWKGALLRSGCEVEFIARNVEKRPVSATADFGEFRHVQRVKISEDVTRRITILCDPALSLDERMLQEQFVS